MQRMLFLSALLLNLSLTLLGARAQGFEGTWSMHASSRAGNVQLQLTYRSATGSQTWIEGHDVPVARLRGLNTGDPLSVSGPIAFSLTRDAGEIRAQGSVAGGQASGAWTFVPSASFVTALARRGIGAPSEKQQFELAIGGFELASLDELSAGGFQRPSVADLVQMVEHGVDRSYVRGMARIPMAGATLAQLVRLRDHGVTVPYAQRMRKLAPQLSADDLVELMDHGVSVPFMDALTQAGYGNVRPSQAERLMDHGVTAPYVAGLRSLGYHPTTDELVRLADHGVTVVFIDRLRSHGYSHLSVDDLIRLRDHGF